MNPLSRPRLVWTKAATAEKHDQIAREIETLMDLRNGKIT